MIVISSCSENKSDKRELNSSNQVINYEFQSIIDSANVKGSVLIYDFQKNIYYSNNFSWADKGKIPASTFKIPNSIIALESGIVENDSTLFIWDGKKRYLKIWEQDLIFRDAFHFSCVPCYQGIARKIGKKRLKREMKCISLRQM